LYGFSAASLGITGFETSSNFIEEQKKGVFVKTLRNMWYCVAFFNPLLSFFATAVIRLDKIERFENVLLSELANITGGSVFKVILGVDAFLVLAGGVLTSYVGVTGLVRRLAGDRCLPSFLLSENKLRGTNHFIIIGFFLICSSLYIIVNGEVETLAGVYSISFLCVMGLFAVSNMLLKYKRAHIPRDVIATWTGTIVSFAMVSTALVLTIYRQPSIIRYFLIYASVTAFLFSVTFFRVRVLKMVLFALRTSVRGTSCLPAVEKLITDYIQKINSQSVVFFCKTTKLHVLNKAILYIRENEDTSWVRIVHVCHRESEVTAELQNNIQIMDAIYPKMRIDAVLMDGEFGPDAVDTAAVEFGIPKNMMFITCPSKNFSHTIQTLGGVRVITHWSSDGS